MEVELRLFATFREVAGRKVLAWESEEGATAGDVLRGLQEEYPDMKLFDDDRDALREYVRAMKNGRQIIHQDGLETTLEDGDTLSVFPPVAGG